MKRTKQPRSGAREGEGGTAGRETRGSAARRLVEELRASERFARRLVHVEDLPGIPARLGALDPPLHAALASGLARRGVRALFSHQAAAIEAVRRGEHVLVTTPTASGKSLVYNLPVLDALARVPEGAPLPAAVYVFPLKALAQDQKAALDELIAASGLEGRARCEIYDGDTPTSLRERIRRDPPPILLTNPDMLHAGILAYHSSWRELLSRLDTVVLDEVHTYKGVFGAHFHHVIARFRRLAARAGARPRFIAASATAANAGEFAEDLAGVPFTWIRESGAPREGRLFALVQPEASPYTEAIALLVRCLEAGLKTIVFTKARRITELMYQWLGQSRGDLVRRVACYRAGFLPEERRRIEADLFEGKLDAVISTSALELGIDVGGLDACILVGFPGSMISTWQRTGRVGRSGRESATFLVALPDALDQYFLARPREFFGRPYERLVTDTSNAPIAGRHLVCAAAEIPLRKLEDRGYLRGKEEVVADLERGSRLLAGADGEEWFSPSRRPQREVSLRSAGEPYAILDTDRAATVGTVDGVRAFHECHPGAVYLHGGRTYQVDRLEIEARRVHARTARLDWYTVPLTEKETEILEVIEEREIGPLSAAFARLKVTERIRGYEKRRLFGQEKLGEYPLELPPILFETKGLYFRVPAPIEETIRERALGFMGGIHAAEHAAISLFPLLAISDRGDIGGISYPLHPQLGCSAVFIYDGVAGGVGLAERGYREIETLLGKTLECVSACECEDGCPSCVHSPKCGNGNKPLDKAAAISILAMLLGREQPLPLAAGAGGRVPPERRPAGAVIANLPRPLPPDPFDEERRRRKVPHPRTVVFDVETQRSAEEVGGWGNVHRMGLALAIAHVIESGESRVFRETEVPALLELLRTATLVVGFNVKRFDYGVLRGYSTEDFAGTLPTYDLLEEIHGRLRFRLGLGHVAKETLGVEKSADGLQCLEWLRQGKWDLIESYCRRDVEITRDLYLHVRDKGYLLYRDREGRPMRLLFGGGAS